MDFLEEHFELHSFQDRIVHLRKLLTPEVISYLFEEFGQTFDKSRHFEIVMQIIVVDLLVETKGKVTINGIELPESTYMVALVIILIHIIDDIFDNLEVFKKVAKPAYLYLRTFSNMGPVNRVTVSKMYRIFKHLIDDLYFQNEPLQLERTTHYSAHREIILSKLETVEFFLSDLKDRATIFKASVINVVLAGLIQNVTKFGKEFNTPDSELAQIQDRLDWVYRQIITLFLPPESKMKNWFMNVPLEVLVSNASGVLEMFRVLGKPLTLDMEMTQALNNILGPCVYLVNYYNDREKAGVTFYYGNLNDEDKDMIYANQLRDSWRHIIDVIEEKYGSKDVSKEPAEERIIREEYNWKNIPEDSFEYRILVAICLVFLFLLRDIGDQKVSFRTMPAEVRKTFLEEFYFMYTTIKSSVSPSIDSYLGSLIDLLKDFDFNPSES